ncbi:MAG: TraR/DksA C4-type zinc finger protein [Actinomycetota bacterium]|nr:TraR/DksA C4-type zinc finger protein [Actinomycetota bacterium]
MDIDIEPIRERLEHDRETLQRQLREHGVDSAGGVDVGLDEGFADSGQVATERAELLSLVEQLQETLAGVEAALARIEDGAYGKCQRCGQDIPPERLEAVPTTTLCVSCKQSLDR